MRGSAFVAIALVSLFTGCATVQSQFHADVDSISSGTPDATQRYMLFAGNKDASPEDLQFREFASYVKRALAARGFSEATSPKDVDIAIFLAYGIGDPQTHHYTYSLPMWGQTGVSSSYTTGTVSPYGTYSATTTSTPAYGVTGYTTLAGEDVTYFRFLIVDAYDVSASYQTNKLVPVWRTTVTSTGSRDDLRRVSPVLVASAQPYLGTNTGKKVRVVLEETSPSVQAIRGIGKEEIKDTTTERQDEF